MIRIDAKATATDNTVGSCKAFLIRRDKDDEFSLPVGDPDMRKETRGLSDLALCLFNPDGSLDKFIRRISGTSPEEQLENIVFERAKSTLSGRYTPLRALGLGERSWTQATLFSSRKPTSTKPFSVSNWAGEWSPRSWRSRERRLQSD